MTPPPPHGTARAGALLSAVLLVTSCSAGNSGEDLTAPTAVDTTVAAAFEGRFPEPPSDVPTGPVDPDVASAIDDLISLADAPFPAEAAATIGASGDPRLAWVLSDLLRFLQGSPQGESLAATAEALTGEPIPRDRSWGELTDLLIAWDLPAAPEYVQWKAQIFTTADERWSFVFDDPDAVIDQRLISWGGVGIDDRPLGDPNPCPTGCIPALDDPALTPAEDGSWYPDDGVIFGVDIGGDRIAFPRNIMEVHEMVNMTIGGRRVAIPYCTLCGSAQVFFTDDLVGVVTGVDRPPVLRTSGLLSRSNKVMYDLDSHSVFDTFTGEAVSGPLLDADVQLAQATVVTTTWADWRTTHPDTRIIAQDGGIGRSYDLDPLRGRDDNGPIFPIGEVDDRLAVQEPVLGVILDDGRSVAFPVAAARTELQAGGRVELADVSLELVGDGLAATVAGQPIASHQAFWFVWSQFHVDTALWMPSGQ